MKTLGVTLIGLLASILPLVAQPNVRAHYTNGQVWVVWDVQPQILTNCIPTLTPALSNGVPVTLSNCVPQTYAIYSSPLPVTNTATATLLGRLFAQEWSAAILRDDINASFGAAPTGFRIPDEAGGYRVLGTNQGLFVHTVRSNFTAHYAVRPFGETNVPAAWRFGPVTATYSLAPEHAPTCHLQVRGTNSGYPVEWWTMWADGDTNLAAARPDFPLMANDHRRGVGHNFFVCEPRAGGLSATNIPACIALHSGDAQARMWLPDKDGFASVGLAPAGGLLIAMEDRLHILLGGRADPASTLPGYVPGLDPFTDWPFERGIQPTTNSLPPNDSIIVPYTLWRFNWTLDWLYSHKGVDSNRVSVAAHSGGAKGSLIWTHANPERFAAVNLYGPGLGDFPDQGANLVGTREQNLPMLLTNRLGQLARATDINQLGASFSPLRDLPFTRVFLGKREENWGVDDNHNYSGDIIEQYAMADQLGLGAAMFWDLREHGVDGWTYQNMTNKLANPPNCSPNQTVAISGSWSINDLWVPALTTQFRRDDATNQIRHRADCSYPAFFNCALRGGHGDPGRVIYTNTLTMSLPNYFDLLQPYDGLVTEEDCYPPFTGDKRGTWSGYFEWEPSIVDTPTNWSTVVFLVGAASAFNPVEVCPDSSRVVDVAIRRPQQFNPAEGALVVWELRDAVNNALFQAGTNVVGPDSLVSIPSLTIPRDPLRTRLIVSLPAPPPPPCPPPQLFIQPLTNGLIELSWPSCPDNFYQVEWTRTFTNWQTLTPPLAAPPTNSLMIWTTPDSPAFQDFRLVVRPLTNSSVPTAPGIYTGLMLVHNGITRQYRVNIPVNYNDAMPAPLALILHGHNQTADEFARNQPALADYANVLGVILVIPDATDDSHGTGWNVIDPTPENPVDDVGFLLALIDELDAALNIDRQRIYAGGFSNGGQMCHFLGARTTNVFAALAAVGSAIAGEFGTPGALQYQPPPSEPLPVIIVNATNDCKRPYWGGLNEDGHLQPPAFDSISHWTNANFCAPSPFITTNTIVTNHVRRAFADSCAGPYPPFNAMMTNLVIREHYQLTCTPGTEVLFVTLTDGGHKWTEAADNVGFDASFEVLQFFLRHCRCDAVGATNTLVIPTAPGRYDLELCDQGYSRLFRLQVPVNYNPAVAAPLVFALHGGGQTMSEFASQHPALFAKCEVENVLLVLPEALDHPQTREPLWTNKPFDYVVDDRSFVTNLLEYLAASMNIDRTRIYSSGFSSGGSFSHYFAATMPGILAAIAPVCTQTGWNDPVTGLILPPPAPLEPVPVMMVRGTADTTRPYNGGPNIDGDLCRSAADDVGYWTAGNLCNAAFTSTATPYGLSIHFPNCAGTTEVLLIRVDGMPHLWPDAADGFGFDANVTVIDFLLRHSR